MQQKKQSPVLQRINQHLFSQQASSSESGELLDDDAQNDHLTQQTQINHNHNYNNNNDDIDYSQNQNNEPRPLPRPYDANYNNNNNDDIDYSQTQNNDAIDYSQTQNNDAIDYSQTQNNDAIDYSQNQNNDDDDYSQNQNNDDNDYSQTQINHNHNYNNNNNNNNDDNGNDNQIQQQQTVNIPPFFCAKNLSQATLMHQLFCEPKELHTDQINKVSNEKMKEWLIAKPKLTQQQQIIGTQMILQNLFRLTGFVFAFVYIIVYWL